MGVAKVALGRCTWRTIQRLEAVRCNGHGCFLIRPLHHDNIPNLVRFWKIIKGSSRVNLKELHALSWGRFDGYNTKDFLWVCLCFHFLFVIFIELWVSSLLLLLRDSQFPNNLMYSFDWFIHLDLCSTKLLHDWILSFDH